MNRKLSKAKQAYVAKLLRDTDMTMREIAEACGIVQTTVGNVNRRLKIRNYRGKKTSWAALRRAA